MRALGTVMRALLNINTIWGLLILVAFVVCVLQHYLPTTTTFPAGALHEGDNTITIAVNDPSAGEQTRTFTLAIRGGSPVIAEGDRQAAGTMPRLVAARPAGDGFALTWDAETFGPYRVT